MRNAERVLADALRGASGPLCMEGLASMQRSRVLEANRLLEQASCNIQEPLPLPYTSEDPYYRHSPAGTAVLDEIHLKGLQVGSCHPGRVLPGLLQDKAFKLGNLVVTALQDQAGSVARLILRNAIQWSTPLGQVQARYPQGAQVLLKEPCLVSEALGIAGTALWVANPACFQVLSRFPGLAAAGQGQQLLKELADRELEAGDWEAAVELYTRCLEEEELKEDASVLLCRRAQAHLQLGCFFKALRDAERAGSSANLVRAQALMALRQYEAAAAAYKLAGASADYRLSRQLDEQSRHGKFDIAAAALSGSQQPFPDFVGPVEVGMTRDGKGRGLFATAPVAAGDLLLVHNPLVCKEAEEQEADLTSRAIAACLACPRARAQVSCMYQLEAVPSMGIFRPNCELDEQRLLVEQAGQQFDASGVEWMVARSSQGNGDALWTLPRFINHSCLPNTSIGRAGPALYVRAARDLTPGSELLRSYLRDPVALLRPWQPYRRSCECKSPDCPSCSSPDAFVCKCPRCSLESRLEGQLAGLCSSFQQGGQLAQVALQVEAKLAELHLGEQQKQWLRTSFAEAYVEYYSGGAEERSSMPPLDTFLHSLHATVPGEREGLRAMITCSERSTHRGSDPAKVRHLMHHACLLHYGEAGRAMYGSSGPSVRPLALAAALLLGPLVATGWGPY